MMNKYSRRRVRSLATLGFLAFLARRAGSPFQSTLPSPFLHARQRTLWVGVPDQLGSTTSEGRYHHLRTTKDQERLWKSFESARFFTERSTLRLALAAAQTNID